MSGWYTSAMNYDMMSQNPWNTMNLHMNQLWDHSVAMQNMYNVPMYDFGNFMPYGNIGCNSYLTNPLYTLNQTSWGTPAWGNMPWNNGGNMNMWWNPWMHGNSNNNSNNDNTDTGTNRKYNRLHTLVKQLVKYDGLSASEQDALNDAIRNTKGTKEEQYERLLEAYNKIDKGTVREFLADGGFQLGVSSDVSGNEKDKDTFYNRLLRTGFEYTDSAIDDELSSIYEDIKSWSGANGSALTAEGFVGYFKSDTYDVLDFVSSWNNKYKGSSDSSRIIDHIKKYYDKIDDKDQKESAKSKILTPLVEAMISRADSVKKYLNKDSKDKIDEAIKELRESLEDTKTEKNSKVDSDLSKAFDTLYLYTRQGAMVQLRNDAKAYYGEIDSAVFNDKLFKTDVTEDLRSEGFTNDQIEGSEVTISKKEAKKASRSEGNDDESVDDDDDAFKNIDKKAANEQISILKANNVIEELTIKKDGATLYQEKTMTGDSDGDGKADYAKIFYINDAGKLVEWTNTKLNSAGNGTEIVKAGVAQEAVVVKASDVAKGKEEVEEKKKEEEKKEIEDYDPKTEGAKVAEALTGCTDETSEKRVASKINKDKLSKDNIVTFLKSYYEKAGYGGEGLLEYLDDDCDNSIITIDMKKNIVESVIEKAKELGLTNEDSYKELVAIYKDWDELQSSDAQDFNQSYKNGWWAWIGAATTYAEAMDKQIEILITKM